MKSEYITRKTLARYAGLLGRGSIAARALASFDAAKGAGLAPRIAILNSGFRIVTRAAGERAFT